LGRDVVTFEAILEVLSNDERIKPGMTANVEVEVDRSEDAITVPVEAVVHRMRKELDEKIVEQFDKRQENLDLSERARQAQYIKVVYVMEDDVARVRLIEPGIADSRRVELRDGATIDDVVIIGPYRSLDQIKDGKKVVLADKDEAKEGKDESGSEEEAEEQRKAEEDQQSTDDNEEEQTVAASTTP